MAQVQNGADALSGKDDVRKRFGIMARELFRMFKYVERGQLDDERAARDAISAVYLLPYPSNSASQQIISGCWFPPQPPPQSGVYQSVCYLL